MSGSASADTCEPMSEMADAVHSLRNAGWRQRLAEVNGLPPSGTKPVSSLMAGRVARREARSQAP